MVRFERCLPVVALRRLSRGSRLLDSRTGLFRVIENLA